MADIGDLVRYRVHQRHETVTAKLGPEGQRGEKQMVEGSSFHFAHRTFAGVIAAKVTAPGGLAAAPGAAKEKPQFIVGLFVPDKAMAYVHAVEGKERGQFEVCG